MEVYRVEVVEIEQSRDLGIELLEFGPLDGCLCEIWLDAEGRRHRKGGPALAVRRLDTGTIVMEAFYQHGKLHREDGGPARYGEAGSPETRSEEWFIDGELSREGAPARIVKERDIIVIEQWCRAGKDHREYWPARIVRSDEGHPFAEYWYLDGIPHNPHGPAKIQRSEDNAVVTEEEWLQHGLRHRLDGPAYIERDGHTGAITNQEFYLRGQRVQPFMSPTPVGPRP